MRDLVIIESCRAEHWQFPWLPNRRHGTDFTGKKRSIDIPNEAK